MSLQPLHGRPRGSPGPPAGAHDSRPQRPRLRRRARDRPVLRLPHRSPGRPLRAPRGGPRHHPGRRRHAAPAAPRRSHPRERAHHDRQKDNRRTRARDGPRKRGRTDRLPRARARTLAGRSPRTARSRSPTPKRRWTSPSRRPSSRACATRPPPSARPSPSRITESASPPSLRRSPPSSHRSPPSESPDARRHGREPGATTRSEHGPAMRQSPDLRTARSRTCPRHPRNRTLVGGSRPAAHG